MKKQHKGRAQREELIEMHFLEGVARRRPNDVETLKALGDLYTATGRLLEGLAVDRRLEALCPTDPMVRYNLACSLALTGDPAAALSALAQAVELGYDDGEWMKKDADLKSLRHEKEFQRLLARLG